MPARDTFHNAVRHALEKDGWTITHDPFPIRAEFGQMYIDLGAEKVLAAEREGQKIAVEIKSFVQGSPVSEFHTALGQFINYRTILVEQDPERTLYLAVPTDTYDSFFALRTVQSIITENHLKLIVYSSGQEVISQWIN
ncbi:element excision factor XisH family protein [Leptolyngbya sp. PCC 6406]|uniref:element excision factor XisH family protein n=1 Tax=Leptolyngbya sp. PCC 6406 TaxID=1173264 RepID=UPI0002ACC7CE|nr:element excision factor XisH family protein [Leptolyngbya sp. PCC 6406]